MNDLGFVDVQVDDLGSVFGRISGSGSAPPVMMSCHLDMVAAGDPNEWMVPPFDGRVQDGVLHGRGAMDIKGPLALQTYAAASMAGQLAGDLIVAHTVLEERGGWGMQHLVESGRVNPAAVIIGESTHGDVTIGHRGRAEFEVVIRGLASHASAPERARNPLAGIPIVLDAIRALDEAEASDAVLGKATAVATGIDIRPESRNVIPDEAVVVVDWRILPGDTRETLTLRLRSAVENQIVAAGGLADGLTIVVRGAKEHQRTYTGVEETRDLVTPGFLMEADHPIVTAAAAAVGRLQGQGSATVRPWTFATDGGWTCGVNRIPTVGFAPGEERFAHTNTEQLNVDEARWGFERMPALVAAIQEAVA